MKARVVVLYVVAVAAGLAAFFGVRACQQAPGRGILLDRMPELTWLHRELRLTDEQFVAVRQLHVEYRPKCDVMCQRIAAAARDAESLATASRRMTPELEAAVRHYGDVQAECRRAMIEHLYQTAAVLDPERAKQYLDAMLPHALGAPQHTPACHEPD